MKLLSFIVPCYNSQDYMDRCISSLLVNDEEIEIIIVNDGSNDGTRMIADSYESMYPSMVKVVHQENKGHGGAVNTGIKVAAGLFVKVVDSDDWVDREAYQQIRMKLKALVAEGKAVDMVVSNFVYEKTGKRHRKVMKYDRNLPEGRVFTWDEIKSFRKGQYILMHSIIYRTNLLKECRFTLPEHTFYVDNLFVFKPLEKVKRIYYVNVDFYRYFIGREDQSVNEKVMIERIDQQLKVNKLMIDGMNIEQIKSPKLRQYMLNYLEIITIISTILLIRSRKKENLQKKKELWKYMNEKDIELYNTIRYGVMGRMMNIPGYLGRSITVSAYKVSQKIVGFN
ncbi:glycosyltransferase [Paenibacillus sp. LMG 31459]|jgi:glycosyltransferase involved in cell wall biosynthesis|uniref:Glycosyltransferase n=1 Tax=Paenibacillus phytohabitans TaxID=2654978 RepID=A0ABX1YPB4_9BACL|nr:MULTISPECIES: glycosyltransferase family 2 protein [Paenibacillus]AIQ31383.1 glycosyl transferase [Paenibacillus sp. FSL P4-0081]KHL97053.1 glycosyl transferase [Paenibacillus sp. IHB B 3415]NOU82728.1 glycosyltransferase [Paenibacillus phytohabitans]OMF28204.1 glycosyl transferase [Paenibacillus sp. FSL H8-0259]